MAFLIPPIRPPRSGRPAWLPCAGMGFGLVVAAAALSGCGDACEDLQVICDRCLDPNHKAACEESIDRAVDESRKDHDPDYCEQQIDSYDDVCPL